MKVNIDLGESYEGMAVTSAPKKDEKHYPTIHYNGDKPLKLPKEGTMTIRYKEVNRTESENEDGDEHYSCTIEVREILDVTPDKSAPTKSGNAAEDALDALMKEHMADEGDE